MGSCEDGARAGYRDCLRYQKVYHWIAFTSACLYCITVYFQDWFSALMMFFLVCFCIYVHDHWRKEIVDWVAFIENAKRVDEAFEHMNEQIRAAKKKVQDDETTTD